MALLISSSHLIFVFQSLKSVDGEDRRATPEELIHVTKPITSATAKAVAAGKSCRQEDMVACANIGRKAVFDMIHICRVSWSSSCCKESLMFKKCIFTVTKPHVKI